MKINKISNSEFKENSVSSLPTRPNSYSKYGNEGMSAEELKRAFDKSAEILKERLNSLIETLYSSDTEESIASEMQTGIEEIPTLKMLFESIENGTLASKIKLTDDYNLLNFATKIMTMAFPEKGIEFVKVEKKDGVYKLPSEPYVGKENCIYLIPSGSALTFFNSYIWNGVSWELWSSGALDGYFSSLCDYIDELSREKADREDLYSIEREKADQSDLDRLISLYTSSCSGAPLTYNGTLEALSMDKSIDKNRIYLICDKASEDFSYWCYFDGTNWVKGGKYLENTVVDPTVSRYSTLAVQSGAVKSFIETCLRQSLSLFAKNQMGTTNLFDDTAIEYGQLWTNGNVIASEDYITTDFLDVAAITKIRTTCCKDAKDGIDWLATYRCFYDIGKNFISNSFAGTTDAPLTSPVSIMHASYSGIKYVRLSFNRSIYESVTRHMIASTTEDVDYAPYYEFRLRAEDKVKANSEHPVKSKAIKEYVDNKSSHIVWLFGAGASYPKFDTKANKLIFNPDKSEVECGFLLDGAFYRMQPSKSLEIDISPAVTLDKSGFESDIGKIFMKRSSVISASKDTPTDFSSAFVVMGANATSYEDGYIPIATFRREGDKLSANMDCPYFIDNKLYGVSYTATQIDEKISSLSSKSDSDEILSRAEAIKEELLRVSEDDSVCFALCYGSDNQNTEKAMAIYRNVAKDIPLSFLGLCGAGNDPKELRALSQNEPSVPLLVTYGEGDLGADKIIGTLPDGSAILPSSDYVSRSEYYRALKDQNKGVQVVYDVQNPASGYFFTDIEDACLRIIFANSEDIPEADTTLPSGTVYTDNNGASCTLTEDLTAKTHTTKTSQGFTVTQFNFICERALDFRDKVNPSSWATILVQYTPSANYESLGFPAKYVSTLSSYLDNLLFYSKNYSSYSFKTSDGISFNHYFMGEKRNVLANICASYDVDASGLKSQILKIGCRNSASSYEDMNGLAPICYFFSISRQTGRIDVVRGGVADTLSFSVTPSLPSTRNEAQSYVNIGMKMGSLLEGNKTYIVPLYYQNDEGMDQFSFSLPQKPYYGYRSTLILYPNATYAPVEFSYSQNILFTGEDVNNDIFVNDPGKKYTITFWYDERYNAHVRGAVDV